MQAVLRIGWNAVILKEALQTAAKEAIPREEKQEKNETSHHQEVSALHLNNPHVIHCKF